MTPEKQFSVLVGRNIAGHRQRIETVAGSGIPDLNMCYEGVEVWVETKVVHSKTMVEVRPSQVAWHLQRHMHGGRTFFMIRVFRDIMLVQGKDAQLLRDHEKDITQFPGLYSWYAPPTDWLAIQKALFSAPYPWV